MSRPASTFTLRDHRAFRRGGRLLLALALLGLVLSGMVRGEKHVHPDEQPGHAHLHLLASTDGETRSSPDDPAPESRHFHSVVSPVLMSVATLSFDGLFEPACGWIGAGESAPPPSISPGTPHRPPIV